MRCPPSQQKNHCTLYWSWVRGLKILPVFWRDRESGSSEIKWEALRVLLEESVRSHGHSWDFMKLRSRIHTSIRIEWATAVYRVGSQPAKCFQQKLSDYNMSKQIKPVNLKGNLPWILIGRTDAEAEAPIVWPPEVKSWLTGEDSDAANHLLNPLEVSSENHLQFL